VGSPVILLQTLKSQKFQSFAFACLLKGVGLRSRALWGTPTEGGKGDGENRKDLGEERKLKGLFEDGVTRDAWGAVSMERVNPK